MKASFYIVLFVAFIDFIGLGLIYPISSSMFFDRMLPLLPVEASHAARGFWLGIFLCLMPLAQFFSAPVWGAISDGKGRKGPLQLSLVVALFGYIIATCGAAYNNIVLLLVSRVVIGFAAGNMSIVQAAIADLSSAGEKAKNYGLFGMAAGTGFTLGPFFGGFLSSWGYAVPFFFATCMVALNLLFVFTSFQETHYLLVQRKLSWSMGISHLKKAFQFEGIRTILLASFLHNFAWSYFFEFIPIYLIAHFQFAPAHLGAFYGTAGGFYALSTGLLIRPLVKRLKPETLFFGGNLLTALALLAVLLLTTSFWLWPLMFVICYFVAFVTPTSTTLVSNSATPEIQGEALGILSSVNAAALIFSSLSSGSFVGAHPAVSIWMGSGVMLTAALLVLAVFRKKIFRTLNSSLRQGP